MVIFVWFWHLLDFDFIIWFWKCSFCFFKFLENFKKMGISVLFLCLVKFSCEAIWPWNSVCMECFYYIFNFICTEWTDNSIYFFLIQFQYVSENLSISPGGQSCWHIIVHSILLGIFLNISPVSIDISPSSFLMSFIWVLSPPF